MQTATIKGAVPNPPVVGLPMQGTVYGHPGQKDGAVVVTSAVQETKADGTVVTRNTVYTLESE